MASAEHTQDLLQRAGFSEVRTEEVPVRAELPDAQEYLSFIQDTAGPLGLARQGLSEADREVVRADVEDSLGRFAVDDGYELPCVSLCAAAN